MASNNHKLLVIVPASNEVGTIGAVVDECLRYSRDVLVVDDGSSDGTGDVASMAGAQIITIESRSGQGAALKLGFRYALEHGFELAATVDGDGAHDPIWIPRLVSRHLATSADITIGSRFRSAGTAREIPSGKFLANFFATHLMNVLLRSELTDAASGMRLMGRKVLGLRLENASFAFTYELLHAVKERGLRIEECSIRVRYDGRELLCTQRGELLDLLAFASTLAVNDYLLSQNILWLRSMIESYAVARIRVGGRYIVMLPIKEYGMYSFQEQPVWFVNIIDGTEEWRIISDGQGETLRANT
jgi:glycosyltransferase involved in cell wall biosynthesis